MKLYMFVNILFLSVIGPEINLYVIQMLTYVCFNALKYVIQMLTYVYFNAFKDY